MKTGYLIVNGFLQSEKFGALYRELSQKGEARGLRLELVANTALMADAATGALINKAPAPGARPFAIFWDKDVRLARLLEGMGMRLFNSARAIELCDDKALTHIALSGKLPQPKTVPVPLTFPRIGYTQTDFLKEIGDYLGYPFVIKECFGSFGAQVYLARDFEEAEALLQKTAGNPILAQEYIESSAGRDVRVYVAGGRAVAAMLRQNTRGDFRANVAQGAAVSAHSLSAGEEQLAVRAAQLLGCDFAGVDLLFGANGEPLVCEVNSNAHFAGLEAATGADVAGAILTHAARCLAP